MLNKPFAFLSKCLKKKFIFVYFCSYQQLGLFFLEDIVILVGYFSFFNFCKFNIFHQNNIVFCL